ncbi:hypothetical protein GCM10007036_21130 [Alsobacter metallidurans]|uniref:Uncharacterized protein n=1 Tax=Alsobacter metallidurans TaxID=340221 RepID=A0A917I779_9HYPH|nr:hypothetical protein [Alsobacter metallidurans]GGH18751.1 hypothetical protein GCM10007036_21130 [Alsobacter metallidurans]
MPKDDVHAHVGLSIALVITPVSAQLDASCLCERLQRFDGLIPFRSEPIHLTSLRGLGGWDNGKLPAGLYATRANDSWNEK